MNKSQYKKDKLHIRQNIDLWPHFRLSQMNGLTNEYTLLVLSRDSFKHRLSVNDIIFVEVL